MLMACGISVDWQWMTKLWNQNFIIIIVFLQIMWYVKPLLGKQESNQESRKSSEDFTMIQNHADNNDNIGFLSIKIAHGWT